MTPDAGNGPLVSVVVPVKNGASTLDACLRAVARSYYRNVEILVVDDHSSDGTAGIARRHGCRLLTATDGHGANSARNLGAREATGQILVFMDADIIIGRETILAVVETLAEESVDAVVGIYTAKHRHESLVSQYKNLWVRYSYIKSPPAIDWLFGSISGIKKSSFERLGGFDVALLAHRGHDDIELGKRFAQARLNIVLNMDIEVEHLKHYTLGSFVRNEFHRSAGFAELAMRFGETTGSLWRGFVNVYPTFVLSTILAIFLLAIIAGRIAGMVSTEAAGAALVFYLLVNIRFLNYLEQVRGLFAMGVMIPFLFIDHLVCFVGGLAGTVRGLAAALGRKPPPRI